VLDHARATPARLVAFGTAAGPALQWLLVVCLGLAAGGALAGRPTPAWLGALLWVAGAGNLAAAASASGRTGAWWAAAALSALAERTVSLTGLVGLRQVLALLAFAAALRAFSLLYEKQGLHKRYPRPANPLFRSTG
jgi:hypothetical protein